VGHLYVHSTVNAVSLVGVYWFLQSGDHYKTYADSLRLLSWYYHEVEALGDRESPQHQVIMHAIYRMNPIDVHPPNLPSHIPRITLVLYGIAMHGIVTLGLVING
jgi:hypothetical protein